MRKKNKGVVAAKNVSGGQPQQRVLRACERGCRGKKCLLPRGVAMSKYKKIVRCTLPSKVVVGALPLDEVYRCLAPCGTMGTPCRVTAEYEPDHCVKTGGPNLWESEVRG